MTSADNGQWEVGSGQEGAFVLARAGGIEMQKVKGLSGSALKIFAIVTMAVDHTAAILLQGMRTNPEIAKLYWVMRYVIGRFSFPVFCFLLVEGFQKTKNRYKYAGRLLLFALLSEVPFDVAFYGSVWYPSSQNIFFTLAVSFLMMMGMEEITKRVTNPWAALFCKMAVFLAAAFVAEQIICCDYGANGVIAITVLYLFRQYKWAQLFAGCIAFLWEVTAPLGFIPVAFYNGQRGWKLKYVFYAFYPVHLMILYLIFRGMQGF